MTEYDTTGPHGCTRCLRCSDDISGDVEGPYCSETCRYKNRQPGKERDYLTTDELEGCGTI